MSLYAIFTEGDSSPPPPAFATPKPAELPPPPPVQPEAKKFEESSKPDAPSGAHLKFLQSQLKLKKHLAHQTKPKALSKPFEQKNPLKDSGFNLKPRKAVPLAVTDGLALSFIPKALVEDPVNMFGEYNINDEYDPTTPSDYFTAKVQRDERRAKKKMAQEIAERALREHEEEEMKRKKGAAIAPPTALLEESPPAPAEEPQVASTSASDLMPPPSFIPSFGSGSKGLGVAANIMTKMGYKEGSGLGKTEQGMSTALSVEKVGKNAGLIKSEKKEISAQPPQADFGPITSNMAMVRSATKILLLRNMVGKAEIDDGLEPEIRGEMQKYGQVAKVVIHSFKSPEPEEEVRIFVEFTNVAQSTKAFIDLNGRFFGGRAIRAGFYPVNFYEVGNYDKMLLAPS
ncbi:hypothetical protein L596_018647 [Steinernema carpocapsae]|uniref:RNA-binding motif protein 17 n=1 Tax=Steinernema carpocapsae TaxID=34508 RepID=A0A4U5N5A3_STECR|nr:hypothetical protein L596_018647 [Steinernema carpocapsae]